MPVDIKTPQKAQRLARVIASDILGYNAQDIADGLKNDDLFERLEQEIVEARKQYNERVDESIRKQYNFLERALVDVLINKSAHLPTRIW